MTENPPSSETESDSQSLWDDPLIQKIRAIRRRLWEESGGDIRRYIERSRLAADRWPGRHPKGTRHPEA